MKLVEVTLQEQHAEQGGEQHLRASHHLVDRRGDIEQANVH